MSLKNNKYLRRLAAALMSGVMMASMMGMTAFAAEINPATGITFTKEINMAGTTKATDVPEVKFSYAITAGVGKDASADGPEIKAPIATEIPTTPVAVVFDGTESVTNNKISKTVTLDFSSATFTAPGIYRYIITESMVEASTGVGTHPDIVPDPVSTRYLDIYVENNTDPATSTSKKFIITHFIMFTDASDRPDNDGNYTDQTGKSAGYTSTYTTYDLSLQKNVTGEMGDRTKDFEFSIEFDGGAVNKGVSLKCNGNSIILDSQGKGKIEDILLKNSGVISVTGIPSNVKYTVVEHLSAGEGYTTSYTVNNAPGIVDNMDNAAGNADDTSKVTGSEHVMGKGDNAVVFTNNRDAVTPTGVIVNIAPYVAMVVLAAGLAFLFLRRRKRDF